MSKAPLVIFTKSGSTGQVTRNFALRGSACQEQRTLSRRAWRGFCLQRTANVLIRALYCRRTVIIDNTELYDKNWTTCDNTSTSPYYGNCYAEWDQAYGSGDVLMSRSHDGGLIWAGAPFKPFFGLSGAVRRRKQGFCPVD